MRPSVQTIQTVLPPEQMQALIERASKAGTTPEVYVIGLINAHLNNDSVIVEELNPQAKAMQAVLQRSAERMKDMPISGETKDTLEMIRKARAGEMWGYEPSE